MRGEKNWNFYFMTFSRHKTRITKMTSYATSYLQLTKEVLERISKDNTYISRYQCVQTIVANIYRNIQRQALRGVTKYIYNVNYDIITGQEYEFMAELIKQLRDEFTGCMINYLEKKESDGSISERIILIDWS